MKILVTGVAGFAGGYIAKFLYAKGHDVIGVVRRYADMKYPFQVVVHDLSSPLNIIEPIDVIVHAAGVHPGNTVSCLKHNNVDTMQTIIDFAKRHETSKVIYLSTVSVYGTIRSDSVNEDTDIINPDLYGMTKYLAEQLLLEQYEINGICLRLPGIFGYGATRSWLVNTTQKICEGKDVTIYAPDFLSNNFVYVKDLAKFICTLLSEKISESIYLLGAQQRISISDLVFGIKNEAKSNSMIHIGVVEKRPFFLDVRKAVDKGFCSVPPLEMVAEYFKQMKQLNLGA